MPRAKKKTRTRPSRSKDPRVELEEKLIRELDALAPRPPRTLLPHELSAWATFGTVPDLSPLPPPKLAGEGKKTDGKP